MTLSGNTFSRSSYQESVGSFGGSAYSTISGSLSASSYNTMVGVFAMAGLSVVTGSLTTSSYQTATGTFANSSYSSATGNFSRTIQPVVQNASWDGDNITTDYYAFDEELDGTQFGQGMFGGIRHFNK